MTNIGEPEKYVEIPDPEPVPETVPVEWPEKIPERPVVPSEPVPVPNVPEKV
jgi:hypothetical protein